MSPMRGLAASLALVIGAAGARGDPDPPAGPAADLPAALIATLGALGASSGVPDGLGATWEPARPVAAQPSTLALFNLQAGLTVPIQHSAEQGVFCTGSVRALFADGAARLPNDHVPFPDALWDMQAGGAYVGQLGGGQSWGVCLTAGSASDRPFHSVHEATVSAFAFWRSEPTTDRAWIFYLVSVTNGQVGRNFPIPGVAYEFQTEQLKGVVGLPFLNVIYRPFDALELNLEYAAITDVRCRANVLITEGVKLFGGFDWDSESWFRAGRPDHREQTYWYEKRLEGGATWADWAHVQIEVAGGYTFDRYFLEARGFTLVGRNHIDLAAGPFVRLQIEVKF
jgi:hypothetical protein